MEKRQKRKTLEDAVRDAVVLVVLAIHAVAAVAAFCAFVAWALGWIELPRFE